MVTRSTDDARAELALPRAIELKNGAAWADREPRLGALLSGAPAAGARAKWLAQHLRDPDFVHGALRSLPVACLVVLTQCLDRQGVVDVERLAPMFERWGTPPTLVQAAYEHLVGHGLGWWPAHNRALFIGFREPLWASRTLLRGLVDAPKPLPASAEGRGPGRDLAAAMALLTHRSLRTTQEGDLNRTKLKGFVKGNGLVPEEVSARVGVARRLGLIREGDDDDLHVDVPIARAFLARPGRVALTPLFVSYGDGWLSSSELAGVGDAAVYLRATCEVVQHEGAVHGRPGTLVRPDGDGHVTPSFEVLLGPEADASLTLVVGMVAELQRADHVLTHRLTPASIARGLAAGLSIEVVRAELERVSKRPLPETVTALLDDAARRNLRARTVVAIEGHAAALDAIAGPLGARVVGRPSPECLLVSGDVDATALAAVAAKGASALDASGIRRLASSTVHGFESILREAREREERAREDAFTPIEPRSAEPALRARFEKALAERFAADVARLLGPGKSPKPFTTALSTQEPLARGSKREVVPTPPADAWLTEGPPRPETPAEAIRSWDDAATESRAAGRAGEARYFALVAQAAREVEAEVVAWATANQEPDFARRLLDDEELAAFAFLAPHWRRGVLAVASDVDEVIGAAADVDAPNARSALGRKGYGEVRALGEAPVRPGREDDALGEHDDYEILEVLDGPPSERAARKLVDDVIADEVALRVTERAADGVRTYVLFPDAVRKRGQQLVMVGEDEGGASRVVALPDIVKLEVIAY